MAGDTVGEIKARLSIADVVGSYVKLQRAGRSMVGLCPFHKEKTPSFHVSLERGTYHCFGCGEGGDMFAFVQKAEGVDFKGALTILAEKAGVRVEYAPGARERADKRERLSQAMARAASWYAAHLPGSAGDAYAKKRGLSEKTIKEWGIVYVP
jgi:DNA primase